VRRGALLAVRRRGGAPRRRADRRRRSATRRRGLLLAALTSLVAFPALAGCGGIVAPDLFAVSRTGSAPGARLTLVINEEGMVRCNDGRPRRVSDPQLIQARTIQEHLHAYATHHESLSPRPGSVLSYEVRDADGTVRFADNSAHQPRVTRELALFVLTVAAGVCNIPQTGA
jgi:hypothetical protein